MAGFNASEAVPRLDFDLSPHGPSGVIPEPSVAQVDALTDALRELVSIDGDTSPGAMLAHMARLTDDEQKQLVDKLQGTIADILAPVMTREQLDGLPARIQRAFTAWLLASLLIPEGSSPATTT